MRSKHLLSHPLPQIVWHHKFHYLVCKCSPVVRILSHQHATTRTQYLIYSRLLQSLQTRSAASELLESLLSNTLPAVKKYFNPFSENAADIVEALLRDLKNRAASFHLHSSTAFQNLRNVIKSLQPRLKDIAQDIASCIVTEKGDILDVVTAAGMILTTLFQLP